MRVKAIRDSFAGWPKELPAWGSAQTQILVEVGNEYEVLAISVFDGLVFLMICPGKFFTWMPVWFFETINPGLPADWICTAIPYQGGLQMIIGPEFVAKDAASYQRMVELDAAQATSMWKRIVADEKSADDDAGLRAD